MLPIHFKLQLCKNFITHLFVDYCFKAFGFLVVASLFLSLSHVCVKASTHTHSSLGPEVVPPLVVFIVYVMSPTK